MIKPIITLIILLFVSPLMAQDYYWVGGSGNWSDYANHWATSSGGSSFHTQAPTSTDNVYFDANSFTNSGQDVTLDSEASCLSMDWTGVTNFPTIKGNGNVLNIHGSLTFAADMTANLSDVQFESTTTGNTITTNGTSFGTGSTVRLYGSGGEWSLQDNLVTDNFYMTEGTFNTNSHNMNTGDRFNISGASTKVVNLGSSEITTERWYMGAYNATLNAGTSRIIVSVFYSDEYGAGYTYNDVEFSNYGTLLYDATFNTITIQAGVNLEIRSGDVMTVTDVVSEGSKNYPVSIVSSSVGSEATISASSGTITLDYVELQDIHATGGATFTANNAIDNGNNTGWTINELVGQDYYWVNNGGNWTDFSNHWATTSGGSTMHTDYPGKLDNVFFDANSFSLSNQTVLNDLNDGANFNNMDWTGVTNNPELDAPYSYPLSAYGSVTFVDGMSKSINNLDFKGDGTTDFYSAPTGSGFISYITTQGDGTYNFQDDFSISTLTINGGTVNLNDITIDLYFDVNVYTATAINMGASTINGRTFNMSDTDLSLDAGTSTINVNTNFYGGGHSYYLVVMDGTGTIKDDNTFDQLEIVGGSTVNFTAGSNQTITTDLILDGTKADPITLNSSSSGSQATITKTSGTIDATYLVMKDVNATGGATFNATQTIDNGNNTGWNITGLTGEDYYWVGDGGDWSDFGNHWATTSGGSTMHTTVPGVLDNVIFDANSFTMADQVVNVTSDEVNFNDMTQSGVTNSPIITANGKVFNIYGSLDLDGSMTTYVFKCIFLSSGAETISMTGGSINDFEFSGTGSWTFQSAIDLQDIHHYSGSVDFNNQTVNVSFETAFYGTELKSMTLGTSDYFTRLFRVNSAENITFDGSSSSITSSSTFDVSDYSGTNSFSFNDFTFTVANSTDEGRLYADMTFNTLTFEPGTIIELEDDITLTVNNLIVQGTAESPIEIKLLINRTVPATISQASGTVDGDYLILENTTATGGATFNAYNSVNNGNVSGWVFHKNDQTIDFPTLSDMTYGDGGFALSATASSSLDVSFSLISGPATLVDGFLTPTGAGTVQVKAMQAGDIDYNPAPSVIRSFEVFKADQSISFDVLPAKTYGDAAFTLTAGGGDSGNEVTFASSNTNVAMVSGSEVTIVGAGTTTITASQAGNDNYNAATDVPQALVVDKADQTITFAQIPDYEIGVDTEAIELMATSSSELTVTYQVSGPATLNANLVTPTGTGTVTVTASQDGDTNYNAATDVVVEFSVTESQTLGVSFADMQIYPNPTTERFQLSGMPSGKITQIQLRSLDGKLIHAYKNVAGTKDISDLKPGVYLLDLYRDTLRVHTARLVVR